MQKRTQNIRQTIEAPLLGFGVVMLALACFLIMLWVLIVIVRVVLG